MARQRDYRAEYQRRIEKGRSQGRTVSQARGHAPRTNFDRALQRAVTDIEHGRYKSPTEAARKLRLPVEKLRNYIVSTGQGYKEGGVIKQGLPEGLEGTQFIQSQVSYHVPVISDSHVYEINVRRRDATLAGQYMSAVGVFIRTGDAKALEPFEGKAVTDIYGKKYELEVDPSALMEVYTYEDIQWDEIYRRNG